MTLLPMIRVGAGLGRRLRYALALGVTPFLKTSYNRLIYWRPQGDLNPYYCLERLEACSCAAVNRPIGSELATRFATRANGMAQNGTGRRITRGPVYLFRTID
jgi:hypothetical protein